MEVRNALLAAAALCGTGVALLQLAGRGAFALVTGAAMLSVGIALAVMAVLLWWWERSAASASLDASRLDDTAGAGTDADSSRGPAALAG